MVSEWVWFNAVAPWWRAPFRPVPGLGGSRRWLRWQVIRETRPVVRESGIVSSAYEHHSLHWTSRSARRTAHAAQVAHRYRKPDGGESR